MKNQRIKGAFIRRSILRFVKFKFFRNVPALSSYVPPLSVRKTLMACIPNEYEFESYVTGRQIYKKIWTPVINEDLSTETEPENPRKK